MNTPSFSLSRGILPRTLALTLAVFLGLSVIPGTRTLQAQTRDSLFPRVLIAWSATTRGADSLDQQSFLTALRVTGLRPRIVPAESLATTDLSAVSLLVIPNVSARTLGRAASYRVLKFLRNGLKLVSDGPSPLMRELGIAFGPAERVFRVHDHTRPPAEIRWPDTPGVRVVRGKNPDSATVLYSTSKGRPLALLVRTGNGLGLCFAPLFDPLTGEGFGRFPSLPDLLVRELSVIPPIRRNAADAYFDPGYRESIPPVKLAALWKKWGIRTVHIAAWDSYSTPSYPYRALLKALHEAGILGYAWLEWPYIGKGFWDRHPEWREKNALLQDAHIDFLYLMDLQNPDCMQAASRDLTGLLQEDWDGIDVAEFSITGGVDQALEGPGDASAFTGFTDISRQNFRSQYGFDPLQLFDRGSPRYWKADSAGLGKFYRFRIQTNDRLLRQMMRTLDSLNRSGSRQWELMLTVLDNTPHPEAEQLLATSMTSVIQLVREFGFTLQVEDLASQWVQPPDRYTNLGAHYRNILGSRDFSIDINVVPSHTLDQTVFATEQAIGAELARQWESASVHASRVCFYAENSVYEPDWDFLPFSFASRIEASKRGDTIVVNAPETGIFSNPSLPPRWLLDGRSWPAAGQGFVILPKGAHTLLPDLRPPHGSRALALLDISDELLACSSAGDSLSIDYEAPARCAITLSKPPSHIAVDGIPLTVKAASGNGGAVILAPRGRHRIIVRATD